MRKVFVIDGGAGRVLTAIPALEKYVKNHPEEDVKIVIFGWDNLLWGNKLLQDITFSSDTKGIFDTVFKDADFVVTPEPYKLPAYYKQEISIVEAFDVEINNTSDHSDLTKVNLFTNKAEEKAAANLLAEVRQQQKKEKTIVIQPFGRSSRMDAGDIIDDSSRGLDSNNYLRLVKKLSTKYNLVLFAERGFWLNEDVYTFKTDMDLRAWMSVIDNCDYFIGCDSVGQHMARSFNKPGTVILGSTFAKNISYPDFFQIIEKDGIEKKYSPIRISGLDSHLADRLNDGLMDFTEQEIDDMVEAIIKDIEKKVK